MVFKKVF